MSQQNIQTMRQGVEAINRRDKAAWLDTIAPDAVMVPTQEWPENAPIRGADAIWDFYVEVNAAWADRPSEVNEVIDVRGDVLVANVRRDARGKTSGVAAVFDYWLVTTFREGRAARQEWFSDRTAAVEAASRSPGARLG